MFHDDSNKGGMHLSPKASFLLGLVGGVMVLCTIGFFILLAGVMSGKLVMQSSIKQVADVTAPTPTPPSVPTQPEPAAPQVGEVAPITAADHVQGPANAAVTLLEYSDFECPFCQRFEATMQQVMTEYKGKIRWVFRNFPLSFHASARPAANAAECAAEQGKFWEFSAKLYENQSGLGDALYSKLAVDLKLNKSKFDACVAAKKYDAHITADQTSGSAAGIDGTPATIIIAKDGSKTLIPGALPFDSVKPMIDAALAK